MALPLEEMGKKTERRSANVSKFVELTLCQPTNGPHDQVSFYTYALGETGEAHLPTEEIFVFTPTLR